MKQLFHHHSQWEDAKAGLYRLPSVQDSLHQEELSVGLLASPAAFYAAGLAMIQDWPVSAEVNLSNRSRNRQAWVGQASCCFNHRASEQQTKQAWWRLSDKQRQQANETADCIINIWERFYA